MVFGRGGVDVFRSAEIPGQQQYDWTRHMPGLVADLGMALFDLGPRQPKQLGQSEAATERTVLSLSNKMWRVRHIPQS